MLMGLALTAFQLELDAQSRGNARSSSSSRQTSSTSSKSSVSRSSSSTSGRSAGTSSVKSNDKKPSPSSNRLADMSPTDRNPSRNHPAAKPSSKPQDKPTAKPQDKPAAKPATRPHDKPAAKPATKPGNRPVAKPGSRPSSGPTAKPAPRPGGRPAARPNGSRPAHRPNQAPRPPRVHPRDRDFLHYNAPRHYWAPNHHYYGYRVRTLPSNVLRRIYRGTTYYFYNDIWYRPYNDYYVVCRPPFGTVLAANLISDMAWTIAQMSYYNGLTQPRAQVALGLANQFGLSQVYADPSTTYYYQDGVFYSIAPDGQYYVIIPPAGALVDALPEDFETIYLGGEKYFKVDDTIYQFTVSEGRPYFEVLGQMN